MSNTNQEIIIESLELGLPVIDRLYYCMQAARNDERTRIWDVIENRIAEIDREPTMSAGSDRKRELTKLLNKI